MKVMCQINVIGGAWLKERNNYDREMCRINGWKCFQEKHFDAIIDGKRVEVKKTKTNQVIVKLQQLAEIYLDKDLHDIYYLIIRTDRLQKSITETLFIPGLALCELQGLTPDLANDVLLIHREFHCTIQNSMRLEDIRQHADCKASGSIQP